MSGFSSLLNQFKQTTQQATSSLSNTGRQSTSSTTSTVSNATSKKRTRSIFETTITNNQGTKSPNNTTTQQQSKQYKYPTKPIKTIYIACPAYAETGGPEALHQLCHMINVGDYTYEVDDDDIKEEVMDGKGVKCDEFGRALHTDKKPSSTTVTSNATSKTNNNEATTTEKQPKKKVIKAYMLYLRERNNNTVEHVTSTNAKSIKYNKYNAPPIPSSTDVLPSFLQQRGREIDYTIDGVHGNKTNEKSEEKNEEKEGESEEYTSELIIWPECWTHLIDSLQPPSSLATTSTNNISSSSLQLQQQEKKKYQIAIWWLSVNNNNGRFLPNQFQLRKDVLHLVQSMYAKNYVESMLKSNKKDVDDDSTLNVMNMSEFISYASPSFAPKIDNSSDKKEVVRDVDVVYNTAKGQHYTDEIIKRAVGKAKPNALDGSVVGGGLKFAPIGKGHGGRERMTEKEVVNLLKRSKVYIDFGPHPGMDRLPREAALAGCVVLTNREGAANFNEDVPLPSEFKFKTFDVEKIYTKLKECCTKHKEYATKMKAYKQWILGQEKQMKDCVDKLINHVNAHRILVQKIERYTKQSSSTKGIKK